MDPARWHAIAAIAEQALELDDEARRAFVADELARHPELEPELSRVVGALDHADGFVADLSTAFATLVAPSGLAAGEHLGAYEILRPLGWGGMGTVYLARRSDDQYEKTVAVKVLPTTLVGEDERRRFVAERQILAGLEHPAIARLIDGGVWRDQPYAVLEYVEGTTVERFADAASLDTTLDVFLAVCGAVAHAHARLVIHCDLKPANVLVSGDGHVKLLDFGIARMLGETLERPAHGYVETPVTRNYAAPELLAGATVDTRADVYSLGVLLYRLVAGEQPYRLAPGSREELCAALASVQVPTLARAGKLARAPAVLVAELATIIGRAMARDPEHRIASVHELADELGRMRRGGALDVPPAGLRAYRLRKAIRRNPVAAALAVTAGTLGIATVITLVIALVITRAEKQRVEEVSQHLARERQTATEVGEFLVSVFEAADPELRGPSQATARELLQAGLARIGRWSISDPKIGARLDLTLGRIARRIGEGATAAMLLDRAIAAGLEPALEREALVELGIARTTSGEHDKGIAALALANARCEAAGDEGCVLEILQAQGNAELQRNELAAARAALERAIERASGSTTQRAEYLANVTFGLGIVEHRAGNMARATELLGRAEELFRELPDAPSVELANSLASLASLEHARGDHQRAVALLDRARRLYTELYGSRHGRIAYIDFLAADAHAELGELHKARRFAESSLAIRQELLGEHHVDTGLSWGRLAHVLVRLGEDAGATEAAARSRAITRSQNPVSHANIGLLLATLHARGDQPELALAAASESLAFYEQRFGAEHAMTLRGHAAMATALAGAGKLDAALARQRRAIAIGDATLRPDHPRRAELLIVLAELELRAGRNAEARVSIERAVRLAETAKPPHPTYLTRARALLTHLPP
jgi:eukaryotic-like serine/threonine-protein kinase